MSYKLVIAEKPSVKQSIEKVIGADKREDGYLEGKNGEENKITIPEAGFNMTKDEEIRMINEKLDFYVMEASDEEFDTEEVRKLVKRLDELDPIPLPWKSDEEALKDFAWMKKTNLVEVKLRLTLYCISMK